jgi:hypothetical protein
MNTMLINYILICILFIGVIFSQPGTTENSLYHLLNVNDDGFLVNDFQGTEHPALTPVQENAQLSMRYDYEDLYRETGFFNINKNRYVLNYCLPLKHFSPASTLSLHLARERLAFTHVQQAGEMPDINLSSEYGHRGKKYNLGISLGLQHMVHSNRVAINHYPDGEDDWLLNRYFYDLLQPTFGNTIDIDMTLNRIGFIGEYFYKAQGLLDIGAKFSLTQLDNKANVRYFNSTEKLSGDKTIGTPFKNTNFSLQLMTISSIQKAQIRLFFSLDRSRYALDLIPENPSKSGDVFIDYTNLGSCSLKRSGYSLGLGVTYPVSESIDITLGNGFSSDYWQGRGTVYTPVLGFEILPIAHYFKGTVSAGTATNHLQLQFNHQPWQRFLYRFHLGWLAAKVRPQWQGTAYMEFGIDNQQYNEQKTYNADIFVLAFSPTLKLFKKWSVHYALSQLIPLIKEGGTPPAQKPQPSAETQPAKSKISGGRIHQFIISYNF